MRQVILRQMVQHIALVLRLIQSTTKFEATRSLVERPARIMAGSHIVEAKLHAAALQSGELQVPVAVDARVRRAAVQVRITQNRSITSQPNVPVKLNVKCSSPNPNAT